MILEEYRAPSHENNREHASKLWASYLSQTDRIDKIFVENWKGDTEGTLIFVSHRLSLIYAQTGLFAAVVAGFIIESYKNLSRNPNDLMIAALANISSQLASTEKDSDRLPFIVPSPNSFSPDASALRVNICWTCSLCLSIICALGATLVQQWSRSYVQATQDLHSSACDRGRVRAFLFGGVRRFYMLEIAQTIPLILHASVFLFFSGLVDFFRPINLGVSRVLLVLVACSGAIYLLLTIL
ncbi:hypothetical protein K488DRAFT_42102, partial [Vararia minispora EC-137]